jgi:hypothetical protein
MISRPGSGKWVFAILVAILLVVGWAFPSQTQFVLKFIGDLIVLNLKALYDSLLLAIHQRWGAHP